MQTSKIFNCFDFQQIQFLSMSLLKIGQARRSQGFRKLRKNIVAIPELHHLFNRLKFGMKIEYVKKH